MANRKNLKLNNDTFDLLIDEKQDFETWDGFFRRLIEDKSERGAEHLCPGDGTILRVDTHLIQVMNKHGEPHINIRDYADIIVEGEHRGDVSIHTVNGEFPANFYRHPEGWMWDRYHNKESSSTETWVDCDECGTGGGGLCPACKDDALVQDGAKSPQPPFENYQEAVEFIRNVSGMAGSGLFNSVEKCGYDIAWTGGCDNPAIHSEPPRCHEHHDRRCHVCGTVATHECPTTGSPVHGTVCGAPLCDECECERCDR